MPTPKQKLQIAMALLTQYEKKIEAYRKQYGLQYPGGPLLHVLERELFELREICK